MRSFGRAAAVIIAAALILTGIAPRACAAPFTPQMNFAYELATAHWGGPPEDCISIDFEVVPDGSIGEDLGEATIPVPGEHLACILWVVRTEAQPTYFEQMCAVMFHESGHLHGLAHSTNPRTIMYPGLEFVPSTCAKAGLWLMNHPKQKGGW